MYIHNARLNLSGTCRVLVGYLSGRSVTAQQHAARRRNGCAAQEYGNADALEAPAVEVETYEERGYGQHPQQLRGKIQEKRTDLALRRAERLRSEQKERRKQQGDKAQRGQYQYFLGKFAHDVSRRVDK